MVDSIRQALPVIIQAINRLGDRVTDARLVNQERNLLISTERGKMYWCYFKRDFFRSFGKIFSEGEAVGESINKEIFQSGETLKIEGFIFVYPDTDSYYISFDDVSAYYVEKKTERIAESGEVTISFPFSHMKRI